MPAKKNEPLAIGIIGGSGLYQIDELRDPAEHSVSTPFGPPSDTLVGGKISGRQVYFLPRHGRGHRILPHEINHRANIYALRSLNVRWIISVAAVGSLQEKYAPRDVLLPSQFYDRTSRRDAHTFFGEGIAAHIAFAEPISTKLRNLIADSARSLGVTVHNGGYLREHGWPCFFNARGIGIQSPQRFRRDCDDESTGGETRPRSGDCLRDNGDDHRLRLLEGGRGTGFGRNRSQPFNGERGNGEEGNSTRNPTNPGRAELVGTFRLEYGIDHRPEALAGSYGSEVETDLGTVSPS
jgi:hypothetical protein